MPGKQTTFGCGTYLPGFGPDNSPEFDGGGTIDGGGGDDPPPPPPPWTGGGDSGKAPPRHQVLTAWKCTGPTQWRCYQVNYSADGPPPAGSHSTEEECKAVCSPLTGPDTGHPGGPTAPGPSDIGGGPTTPGPSGPSVPEGGSLKVCRCKPSKFIPQQPIWGETYVTIKIIIEQKCVRHYYGDTTGEEAIQEYLDSHYPDCEIYNQTGDTGQNCKENNQCTGDCPDIMIEIRCYYDDEIEDIGGGSPVDGGGDGTGEGDDGGVVITDTTGGSDSGGGLIVRDDDEGDGGGPTSPPPQGPGPPHSSTPPPDGGNGGGPTTPPPQGPGPPPMSTPDDSGGGDDAWVPGAGTGVTGEVVTGDGGGDDDAWSPGAGTNVTGEGVNGYGGGGGSTVFDAGGSSDSADSVVTEPGGGVGTALLSFEGWDKNLTNSRIVDGDIDLNDPRIVSLVLRENPEGIEDPVVAFNISPFTPTLVPNNSEYTELFNDRIDNNIEYVLSNYLNFGNWDSQRSMGVTPDTVYNSLKPKVQSLLKQIRNYDGTPLNKNQIFSMIGTRILDGTISSISLQYLQILADSSKEREPILIKRSAHDKVNEVAAFALIDRNIFPLDPAKARGVEKNIFPNWKTLATDIDKYIEITIGGEIKKYYIKDDDTFIDRSSLSLEEGDYFDVYYGAEKLRIFAKSEIDHAYLIPEKIRQKALQLLGAEGGRTLEVSASILSGIEFDYSLSDPRQDFYMLSCVLSSIDTKPSQAGSFLLKDSTARYELMDTTTAPGLRDVNAFIKYKANHRVFMLDDSDVMLDYIQSTSALTVKQSDILFDSPKENKTIPLLTRQIPWYIMVYPTNRNSLNIFNTKSKVKGLSTSGIVMRQLKCRTSIVPNFSREQTNKFVRIATQSRTGTNVLGQVDPQARITKVTASDTVFQTAYRQNGSLVRAQDYKPARKKTGLRLLKEIITELDTNYLLGLNGIGKSLTEFDVFSRLTLPQFNTLSRLESFKLIRNAIRNGLIANVKMIPPINRADKRISFHNTQLVQRKVGAPADTFVPVKGTNDGTALIPPTTTEPSRSGSISR